MISLNTIPHFRTSPVRSNGAVNYRHRDSSPLDAATLRSLAPSIFAENPHGSRSDRYGYIPTAAVLDGLAENGFLPVAVSQGGSRDEGKRGFTKHLIRLRHRDAMQVAVGDSISEITLLNSHDGSSSYQLFAGVFRLTCSNGLMTSQATIDSERIPHTKQAVARVVESADRILAAMPQVNDTIANWQQLRLSEGEFAAYATAAHALRYEEPEKAPIEPERLLAVNRRDDQGSQLWHVFNRVQENIIRGGIRYMQRDEAGRPIARRQTRPVNGIDQNVALNRALWTLTAKMAELKA